MSSRVAVSGANGFIGARLVARLRAEGRPVLRLVRRPEGVDDAPFRLGQELDPVVLRDVDALVHCAYDFAALGEAMVRRANIDGSARLFAAARTAGVRRLVFVSSVSAFPGCASLYGRGKLEVEARAREMGGAVVRPGLTWGVPGHGMLGALSRLASLPVLPVFDGGTQPMVLAHCDDVAAALAAAAETAAVPDAPILAANPRLIAFRDVLAIIAAKRGKTLRTVSVPSSLGLAGLRAFEALGLPLRFRSDSLVSLLNPDAAPVASAPGTLGIEFRDFATARAQDL